MTRLLSSFAVSLLLAVAPVSAESLTPEQKTEITDLVRNYLLENPELLREMSQRLEEKERLAEDSARGAALAQNAAAVFKNADDPVVGNPKGNVTIVEFFDYNCSWCKRSVNEVTALIEQDKELRVVMKEFPIFGEQSEYAARAALASTKQGKYWELHQALFKHDGPVTKEVTDQLAEEVGLDLAKLKTDMADAKIDAALKANQELARSLVINGTPAFIVDDQVVPGYMALDGLMAAVEAVRSAGGCKLC